jgi:hypothetical protein
MAAQTTDLAAPGTRECASQDRANSPEAKIIARLTAELIAARGIPEAAAEDEAETVLTLALRAIKAAGFGLFDHRPVCDECGGVIAARRMRQDADMPVMQERAARMMAEAQQHPLYLAAQRKIRDPETVSPVVPQRVETPVLAPVAVRPVTAEKMPHRTANEGRDIVYRLQARIEAEREAWRQMQPVGSVEEYENVLMPKGGDS